MWKYIHTYVCMYLYTVLQEPQPLTTIAAETIGPSPWQLQIELEILEIKILIK